jgi:hypothetical protein
MDRQKATSRQVLGTPASLRSLSGESVSASNAERRNPAPHLKMYLQRMSDRARTTPFQANKGRIFCCLQCCGSVTFELPITAPLLFVRIRFRLTTLSLKEKNKEKT